MIRKRYSYGTDIIFNENEKPGGFKVRINSWGGGSYSVFLPTGWIMKNGNLKEIFKAIRGFVMSEQSLHSMGWDKGKPRMTRAQKMAGRSYSNNYGFNIP